MSESGIVGRADLQKKDKGELQAIVAALGGKTTSRARKADLIDQVLELSGAVVPAKPEVSASPRRAKAAAKPAAPSSSDKAEQGNVQPENALPFESAPSETASNESSQTKPAEAASKPAVAKARPKADPKSVRSRVVADSPAPATPAPARGRRKQAASEESRSSDQLGTSEDSASRTKGAQAAPSLENKPSVADSDGSGAGQSNAAEQAPKRPRRRGRAGEPPAEWETELTGKEETPRSRGNESSSSGSPRSSSANSPAANSPAAKRDGSTDRSSQREGNRDENQSQGRGGQNTPKQGPSGKPESGDDTEPGNRRRRRRGRGRDRDDEPTSLEPVAVSGYMELRDDGYGFLRVSGWMPSKDDVYVPVRMVRQCGLRKGDHLVGTARPANRNEKNPAMEDIVTINGLSPEQARNRPLFDDLTPLFPAEWLRLEQTRTPLVVTPRIIDLLAPIGKGQRGLIVSPPKAGKTSIIRDVARSIEKNNPEAHLVVLLIDERPEEVTDMTRSLEHGETVASTFDRPPEEHCALAELTIERAKRMVEAGEDVVILLDGLTRLTRAYNAAGQSSGRSTASGLDAAAAYPPKRFFGSARNLEEGGSLTILATISVETGSRLDEAIFEEFQGTANMELWLDRGLAEQGTYPAINIEASLTRRPELLVERTEHLEVAELRKTLLNLNSAAAGIQLLVDRVKSSKTNNKLLSDRANLTS